MCKPFKSMTLCLVLVLLFLVSCTTARRTALLDETASSQQELQKLVREGDTYFDQMFLYGWRKAEECYSRAYQLKKTPELRERLFLTLCLIAIRQFQEQIPAGRVYDKLEALGDFARNSQQQYLWDMIQHYRTLPLQRPTDKKIEALNPREVDVTAFDLENSPLDTYLYLHCLHYYTPEKQFFSKETAEIINKNHIKPLLARYARHPLFLYYHLSSPASPSEETEEPIEGFAEALLFKGNQLFKKNKLKQAGVFYHKALDRIPDYTQAMNGLANIYYFTLQDYEQAITLYQRTLDLDPTHSVALFGKGVSLHNLGRYEESNQVLDFMLANQLLYHGEAHYYKAYNYYYLQQPELAREWINRAKDLLPDAGEVAFLSGLLYFKEENWPAAEQDFLRVLEDPQYNHCYPLYYLGMSKTRLQNWSFFQDFTAAIACFKKTLTTMETAIQEIDGMEMEESQRQWLVQRKTRTLQEYSEAAKTMTEQMNLLMAQNKSKKKVQETNTLQKKLEKVKALLQQEPLRLNQRNHKENGATLLHQAVIAGEKEVVALLLARGADISITDNEGYTPLNWAVMMGNCDIARLLLARSANVNQRGLGGMTLLHEATYNGNIEMVKLLIEHGAQLDAREDLGKTPMDFAIEHRKHAVLPLLKPLHVAVQKGDIQAIKTTLQKYPSFLESRDENGQTALHLAAQLEHTEALKTLLERGAQANARNIDGLTPLDITLQNKFSSLSEILRNHGAAPTNPEMLAKPLNQKEAILWNLGGPSWAVRTQSRFLIFDYLPFPFKISRPPATPLLGNGGLNTAELANQNLVYLLTHKIIRVIGNDPLPMLQAAFPDMLYLHNDVSDPSDTHGLAPWQKKSWNDLTITAIPAQAGSINQGYAISIDGLNLYYVGHHEYWNEEMWPSFIQEMDFVTSAIGTGNIDIAFFSLSGHAAVMKEEEKAWLFKATDYLLAKLQPHLLVILTAEGEETTGHQFVERYRILAEKNHLPTQLLAPSGRGDRFLYPLR